jgi:hypothetical protein
VVIWQSEDAATIVIFVRAPKSGERIAWCLGDHGIRLIEATSLCL